MKATIYYKTNIFFIYFFKIFKIGNVLIKIGEKNPLFSIGNGTDKWQDNAPRKISGIHMHLLFHLLYMPDVPLIVSVL